MAIRASGIGFEELLDLDERVMKKNNIEPDPRRGPLSQLVRERIVEMARENEMFKEKMYDKFHLRMTMINREAFNSSQTNAKSAEKSKANSGTNEA